MRRAARLVAVVGAAAVAWVLFGEGPREVVLVYDVGEPQATRLEVELRRGDELVRRAEFKVDPARPIRHELRLSTGEYALAWRVATPDGTRQGGRPIEIAEGGTIVLPIAR